MYLSKAKPCPFCGGKDFSFEKNQGDKWGFVVCNTCATQDAESDDFSTFEERV